MVKKKTQSFETRYPTKKAREIADEDFDKQSIHTPLSQLITRWEWIYLDAGGIVKDP